jgi:hypothetical protein
MSAQYRWMFSSHSGSLSSLETALEFILLNGIIPNYFPLKLSMSPAIDYRRLRTIYSSSVASGNISQFADQRILVKKRMLMTRPPTHPIHIPMR